MSKKEGMTYAGTGVNYDEMDPFKIAAQLAAGKTASNIERFGFSELVSSRGESAYIVEMINFYMAFVEEGLGTKNLVADAMYTLTGKTYYDQIAQCTIAMIVNDLITVGALPVSVAMHLAVGDSAWFSDTKRTDDLIAGWKKGCDLARCTWGGGETPTLKGVVVPEAVVLSGSSVGMIRSDREMLSGEKIQDGDVIVIIESSGIHANGLTLARKIADKLPEGYLTKMPSGRAYGEALLDPTIIYVPLVDECQKEGIELHYGINITGHGLRKLMRAQQKFSYVVDKIPQVPEVLTFMQMHGPVSDEEAYGNLNMGAGFALIVPPKSSAKVITKANNLEMKAFAGGRVHKSDERSVHIKPKNLVYSESSLKVR
ncbi:MAG TPA: phosphoribosylformylglycinamidine cyclo-ligase [Candidatus Moranbacteria bacterium]|nr:phosphoribosylformylglycinamidine cyclo-ligase [Candidatus Moranbacteria bacterium]HBT45865.1 phosphoribosylformylglycinamidine cyclo-ligase [Candidatus Moranbacteria bacterium]